MSSPFKGLWLITASFIIALMLSVIPLPTWAVWWRPEWVLLVLIYWAMVAPERISVGVAFMLGLIVDVLNGQAFGANALAMIIVTYIVGKFNHQLQVSPHWQQTLGILVLTAGYQLINLWLQAWLNQSAMTAAYWLPSLTSMLVWPWVFILLQDFRSRFGVA